jgi:hypothetical protein
VNLAGVRVLFELEERLGMRILETLYEDNVAAIQKADRESTESAASVGAQNDAKSDTNTFDKDQAAVSPLTRSGTTQGAK